MTIIDFIHVGYKVYVIGTLLTSSPHLVIVPWLFYMHAEVEMSYRVILCTMFHRFNHCGVEKR